MKLKCFEFDISDSNTPGETVKVAEPINPVTNIFFSDTNVTPDFSPLSSEIDKLFSAAPVFEKNSKFADTGSTAQTSKNLKNLVLPLGN